MISPLRKKTSYAVIGALMLVSAKASEPDAITFKIPVFISFALSPQDTTIYHAVVGSLSVGPLEGKAIQALLHGGTYGHNYFDFPYNPSRYSYADQIAQAGYVALNIDRIGAGLSDHPIPESVPVVSNAFTVHQIVEGLRSGTIAGTKFNEVIFVARSLRSGIALIGAAAFQDLEASNNLLLLQRREIVYFTTA